MARGQAILFGFIIAASMFIATLAYFQVTWVDEINAYETFWAREKAETKAFSASEVLVRNVLVLRPNVLNSTAMDEFNSMDYGDSKKLLGLSRNYSLRIEYANGSIILEKGNATGSVARRCTLLNGELTFVTVVSNG